MQEFSNKELNITNRLASSEIKKALEQRQAARAFSNLFDDALPDIHLLDGIIREPKMSAANVREGKWRDTVSPFVIDLRANYRDPEELFEEEGFGFCRVNLLEGRGYRIVLEADDALQSMEDDLCLLSEDINSQLKEDLGEPVKTKTVARQKRAKVPKERSEFAFMDLTADPFPIHELAPNEAPEHLDKMLDLPEEETEEVPAATSKDLEPAFAVLDEEEPILVEPEEEKEAAKFSLPSMKMPFGFGRALGAFVAVSFAFVVPLHAMNIIDDLRETRASLEERGKSAILHLTQGADATINLDSAGAKKAFSQANAEFSQAEASISNLGATTSLILSALPMTDDEYQTGRMLLEAGEALSVAGERIADGLSRIDQESNPSLTGQLEMFSAYAVSAAPYLEAANERIEQVNTENLPGEQADKFRLLKEQLPGAIASMQEFIEFSDLGHEILGGEGTKKYLAIFQNNTELRATGGFMGSFAELTVLEGKIVSISVPGGGTYDLRSGLSRYVVAPKAMQLLSARWEFQDANWFPDFPTSARQILEFWKDAGGPTVDGVVAVNASYVADLLNILGPIEMPEYGRTIDAENFLFETQKIVELEYDKEENKPKAFIGDLAPKMIDRMTEVTSSDFLMVLERLHQGLVQRDIQFYFEDNQLEEKIMELGFAGEVKWTDHDYLMIVDTNLGGGKTDGVIGEEVDLQVDIAADGSIENTLSYTRRHFGIKGALFSGLNNVDYVRVYVPKGSTLIEADGFNIPADELFEEPENGWEIDDDLFYTEEKATVDPESKTLMYEELDKAVFGNWMQVKPGESSTVTFRYKLPFKIDAFTNEQNTIEKALSFIGVPQTDVYSLLVQKQSGVQDRKTRVRINYPNNFETIWTSHKLDEVIFSNYADGFVAALFEATN